MLEATLSTRRLGCEFEFTMPVVGAGSGRDVQAVLAQVLTANGLNSIARSYSHEPLPSGVDLAVETDSSVHGMDDLQGLQWAAIEMKTRILNGMEDFEHVVPQDLDIARYLGGRVNGSTGFHVHVDFPEARLSPAKIRSLYNIVARVEPILFALVPPSRKTCGFCQPMPHAPRLLHGCRGIRSFRNRLANWNRYYGLNLQPLWGPEPNVEFRHGAATLNPEKARHWVRLLTRIVDHAVVRNCQTAEKPMECTRKGFEAMRYTLGLRSNQGIYVRTEFRDTSSYLLRRWKHFNEPQSTSGNDHKNRDVAEVE